MFPWHVVICQLNLFFNAFQTQSRIKLPPKRCGQHLTMGAVSPTLEDGPDILSGYCSARGLLHKGIQSMQFETNFIELISDGWCVCWISLYNIIGTLPDDNTLSLVDEEYLLLG